MCQTAHADYSLCNLQHAGILDVSKRCQTAHADYSLCNLTDLLIESPQPRCQTAHADYSLCNFYTRKLAPWGIACVKPLTRIIPSATYWVQVRRAMITLCQTAHADYSLCNLHSP